MRTGGRERRPTWVARAVCSGVVAGLLLASGVVPAAALTTPACLAKKLKEWGKLRNCQATENGKALQGKGADPGKCQAKFEDNLKAISAKARVKAIACRYGINGDGTATDYDTGLQWEQKTADSGLHNKEAFFTWSSLGVLPDGTAFSVFLALLNDATSGDGITITGCFADHCDWRLPLVVELQSIIDPSISGCGGAIACIDQTVFGPTDAQIYWSSITVDNAFCTGRAGAYFVFFGNGNANCDAKTEALAVRAVRSEL